MYLRRRDSLQLPGSLGKSLVEIVFALTAFATVVLAVRLATAIKLYRKLHLSDWLMITTALLGWVSAALVQQQVATGFLGKDLLTSQQIMHLVVLVSISSNFATLSSLFGRLAFAVWILRLAAQPSIRIVIYVCMALTAVADMTYVFNYLISCRVGSQQYLELVGSGKCWNNKASFSLSYATGAVNTCVNLTLSLLPGFIVWKLRLQRATKVCIAAIINVSVLAAVGSFVKVLALIESRHSKLPLLQLRRIPAIRPLFKLAAKRQHRRVVDSQREPFAKTTWRVQDEKRKGQHCITTWTGHHKQFGDTIGPGMGHTVTIEGGIRRQQSGRFHRTWYRWASQVSRSESDPSVASPSMRAS